jgi:hypothetical protein
MPQIGTINPDGTVTMQPLTLSDGTQMMPPQSNSGQIPIPVPQTYLEVVWQEENRRKRIVKSEAAPVAAAKQAVADAIAAEQQRQKDAAAKIAALQATANSIAHDSDLDKVLMTTYTAFRQKVQAEYDSEQGSTLDAPVPGN